MLLRLDLNEGAGATAYDSSGNANHCAISGASWVAGRFGSALSFDGVNDTITCPANLAVNDFTIEAWVKPTTTHELDTESITGTGGISGQKYVLFPGIHVGMDAGMGISVGTNGISVYEHGDSYMPPLAVYAGVISSNEWSRITVTYTNKQPRIYLNGTLVRTGLSSPRSNVYASGLAGGGAYGYFPGQMDGIRIYDRALTAEEVATGLVEDCDDGNTSDCDSCHANCTVNTGCGDGRICGAEACDQGGGNAANGDGCSSSCAVESGWSCSGTPSICTVLPVIIGTGTTTQGYPLNTYYSYVYSAAIYTSSEIGASRTITKLAWYPTVTSSCSRNLKIYLKPTTSSALSAVTWSSLTSGATLVYNTTITVPTANQWIDYDITDFYYSNSSNLLVLVENIYGGGFGYCGGETSPSVRYSPVSSAHEFWRYDDEPPIGTGTVTSNRPNIRISF